MTPCRKRRTALEILADLVAFDTQSHKSNSAIIDFIADYLAAYGVAVMRLPNREGDKEALVATIGPPVDDGIVLSGHTDVVPVAGQNWYQRPVSPACRRGQGLWQGRRRI